MPNLIEIRFVLSNTKQKFRQTDTKNIPIMRSLYALRQKNEKKTLSLSQWRVNQKFCMQIMAHVPLIPYLRQILLTKHCGRIEIHEKTFLYSTIFNLTESLCSPSRQGKQTELILSPEIRKYRNFCFNPY
jgi:hypothetical protein